ncbi:MAG: hypothetical protein R3Y32_05885 [Bacillota bacterium]
MYLKNTFNVFSSNFTLTFKLLFYKFIVASICVGIGFATILPLFEPVVYDMQQAGVFDTVALLSQSVSDFTLFSDSVSAELLLSITAIKEILIYHSSSLMAIYLGFGVLLLIWYLCSSAIDVAMCEVINFFCKQKTKRSLVACFITRFVEVCKYTFFKLFLILPVEIFIFILAGAVYVFNIGGIFSTSLAITVIYILIPLKNQFTCLFAPCLVNSSDGVFKSFKRGYALSLSKGVKVYSSNLFIMIMGIMFCTIASISSLGALSLYSFAIYAVFYKCYTMTLYYNLAGVRFYSDSETIVTPYIVKVQEGDYVIDLL